jgi:hypothetical protein
VLLYHKPLFLAQEKIGELIIRLHELASYNFTDWFILNDDAKKVVGSLYMCITLEEIKQKGAQEA